MTRITLLILLLAILPILNSCHGEQPGSDAPSTHRSPTQQDIQDAHDAADLGLVIVGHNYIIHKYPRCHNTTLYYTLDADIDRKNRDYGPRRYCSFCFRPEEVPTKEIEITREQ